MYVQITVYVNLGLLHNHKLNCYLACPINKHKHLSINKCMFNRL